jgi:uncharacterized membrane protein YeaQ/YmgE (transglycosylase-associated protein family)
MAIVIGALAGWLAERFMNSNMGLLPSMLFPCVAAGSRPGHRWGGAAALHQAGLGGRCEIGQSLGTVIYLRNLALLFRERKAEGK